MRLPIVFLVVADVLCSPAAFADGVEDVVWMLGIILVLLGIGFGSLFIGGTWKIRAISFGILAAWTSALCYAGSLTYPRHYKSLINTVVVLTTAALVGFVMILMFRDSRRLRKEMARK